MKLFLIFPFLIGTILFGAVEDHFKKATGKSDFHKIRNIDFIYMINLDERPEKYADCMQRLQPYDIYPYRFSAVNGWELSLEQITDLGVPFTKGMKGGFWGTYYLENNEEVKPVYEVIEKHGRVYFSHCMSKGAMGVVLSHLSVMQDAYDSGYETIWIMEDDIEICKNPHYISDLVEMLDQAVGRNGWDILFTDVDTRDNNGNRVPSSGFAQRLNYQPKKPSKHYRKQKISEHFRFVGSRFGSYSIIVRRAGMKKLLDFFKKYKLFFPYDMEYYLPESINLFTVLEDVVAHKANAVSDNNKPNYKLNK